MSKSVLIFGGGLAGISAAVALSEAGMQVELIEKRPLLGGRASSFIDPKTGEATDECQHGTMRCCTNLTNLLERLGVQDQIDYQDVIHFLDREGKRSVIKGCGLPAPLHTSLSFLAFKSLSLKDKIGIGRGMLAMIRAKLSPSYDLIDMASWFKETGQTAQGVSRFWRPILVSACNEEPELISCTHGFKIFRDGFLANSEAFHFGIPKVPLGTLYTEPALRYLTARGAKVRLRTIVDQIHFSGKSASLEQGVGESGKTLRVEGVTLQSGERLSSDYYVSGLQFDLLLKLLPPTATAGVAYWEMLPGIELSPIAGIQVWLDRKIECPPALALLDRPTEWIFNKPIPERTDSHSSTLPKALSHLSMVISASRPYTKMLKEELLAKVMNDLHESLPETREANILRSSVIRWPKATISPKPGVDLLRPDQQSPIENLFVAGEWTQTGWPSTMEGAVRSGYLAAERLLQTEGKPTSFLAKDLPESPLFKLLKG